MRFHEKYICMWLFWVWQYVIGKMMAHCTLVNFFRAIFSLISGQSGSNTYLIQISGFQCKFLWYQNSWIISCSLHPSTKFKTRNLVFNKFYKSCLFIKSFVKKSDWIKKIIKFRNWWLDSANKMFLINFPSGCFSDQ